MRRLIQPCEGPIEVQDTSQICPPYLDEWAASMEDHDPDCDCAECAAIYDALGPKYE